MKTSIKTWLLAIVMALLFTQANAGFLILEDFNSNTLPSEITYNATKAKYFINTNAAPSFGVDGSSGIVVARSKNSGFIAYFGKDSDRIDLAALIGDSYIYKYRGPSEYMQICHLFVGDYAGYGGRRLTVADGGSDDGSCGVYQIGDKDVGIFFSPTDRGRSSAW